MIDKISFLKLINNTCFTSTNTGYYCLIFFRNKNDNEINNLFKYVIGLLCYSFFIHLALKMMASFRLYKYSMHYNENPTPPPPYPSFDAFND